MSDTFERYLTLAEERRLFSHMARLIDPLARRDHAWMRVLRHTGVRVGAFSRLTCLDARQAIAGHYLALPAEIQKRRRAHKVFCNRAARQALADLLAARKAMGHPEQAGAPLVMSRANRPMSVRSYQIRLRAWAREAGIDARISPHWFRHTLAKRLISASESHDPLGVVQGVLGHASRNSTAIYAAPDREQLERDLESAG